MLPRDGSSQVDTNGLGVGAIYVDLIPSLQLVVARIGIGLCHATNGDVHTYAGGLTAWRQQIGTGGILPSPVILLLCQRNGATAR